MKKKWILSLLFLFIFAGLASSLQATVYVNRDYYWHEGSGQWRYNIVDRHYTSGTTVTWGADSNYGQNGTGSPYIIEADVIIEQGATLTVTENVQVEFDRYRNLTVLGTLTTQGTEDAPVTFSGGSGANRGHWRGVIVREAGSAAINHTAIRHGGWGISVDGANRSINLYKSGSGSLTLTHTTLDNSSGNGLMVIDNTGTVSLNHSTFTENGQSGLLLSNAGPVTAEQCTFSRNNRGVNHQINDVFTSLGNTFSENPQGPITIDGGTLTRDMTWNYDQVPMRILGDVIIDEEAELTVNEGVVLEFDRYRNLTVLGTLITQGTETAPVTFLGNGAASRGHWRGVIVREAGSAAFNHTAIRHGGWGVSLDGANRSINLYKSGSGSLTLTHTTLDNSSGNGLMVIDNTGTVSLNHSTFTENGQSGLLLSNAGPVTAEQCTFSRNNRGVNHQINDVFTSLGNTFSENPQGPITIDGGTLTRDMTWNYDQVPMRILGDVTIDEEAELTVNEGVVLEFDRYRNLTVLGTLTTQGTEDAPVTFSGGSGANRGHWRGVIVREAGSAAFNHTAIRHGGWGVSLDGANRSINLYKSGSGSLTLTHTTLDNSSGNGLLVFDNTGTVTLNHSTFTENGQSGLLIDNSDDIHLNSNVFTGNGTGILIQNMSDSFAFDNQTILGNTSYGVRNLNSETVDARNNWWGDITGPHHPVSNPGGQANKVSDNVSFIPWLHGVNTHTLHYSAGEFGSILGDTLQIVEHGQNGTPVEAVPHDGYQFVAWSDGITDNPRTDENITGNLSVEAEYSVSSFLLTLAVDPLDAGTVTGEGDYDFQEEIQLSATANEGYVFVSWNDIDDIVSTEASFAYTMPAGDVTLTAHFREMETTSTQADEIPKEFALGQNYPNPFNPSTSIHFALPETSHVRIAVFNLLGQEVAVLINEDRKAGWHAVSFHAEGLSSGLYLYRMVTAHYIETKQMFLVK